MRARVVFARLLLVLVFLLPLAAGCGGGDQPAPTATPKPTSTPITGSGAVTLLSPFVSDDFTARLEQWAVEMQEEASAIEVHVEVVSDSELDALLVTGDGLPDVMLLPAEYLADLAARDLLDLEAAATAFEGVGASKFYAVPVAHVQRGGIDLLAVPYYGAVQGIWYRKDLFEEEGLDAPNTAENILKAAQALHNPDGSLYGIALPTGGDVTLTYHALAHLAQGAGAHVFGEDGTPEFTAPEFVSTLQLYADLATLGTPEGTTMAEARELFLDGDLAMIVDSTSLPQELANRSEDVKRDEMARNMGFVAAIGDGQEDGVTYAYTLALAISKGANRDAAQALADFLLTDAYNVYWIPQGWSPTLKGFALQWRALKGHDWFGYYELGMPEDLTDGLRKAPGWGISSEAAALTASRTYSARLLSAAVNKVLSGEMDAEQAAGWLQEEAAQLQP